MQLSKHAGLHLNAKHLIGMDRFSSQVIALIVIGSNVLQVMVKADARGLQSTVAAIAHRLETPYKLPLRRKITEYSLIMLFAELDQIVTIFKHLHF